MKKTKETRSCGKAGEKKIREEVVRILSHVARIDVSDIKDDSLIREDLGIDSLNAMEIIAAIEIKFKITVDESRAFDIVTVADLIECIKEYIAESGKK